MGQQLVSDHDKKMVASIYTILCDWVGPSLTTPPTVIVTPKHQTIEREDEPALLIKSAG